MNALSCQPVIFGPHITPHCPAVPWWHVTAVRLGWWIVALVIAAVILSAISEWIRDRWEITCGHRVTRRWYGTGSRVRIRDVNGEPGPARYAVLGSDDEHTSVPWLLLLGDTPPSFKDDDGSVTVLDEDPEAFWVPATECLPDSVRRFRPHLIRCVLAGRVVLVPWLVKYLPLPAVTRRGES
jgi:hypothetical protein